MPLKRLRFPPISAFHVSDKLMKGLRAISNAVIHLKDLSQAVSIGLWVEPVHWVASRLKVLSRDVSTRLKPF
ncbi:hypothetical protein Hanom_Chr00s000007g01614781 [Helianthus anomalus]